MGRIARTASARLHPASAGLNRTNTGRAPPSLLQASVGSIYVKASGRRGEKGRENASARVLGGPGQDKVRSSPPSQGRGEGAVRAKPLRSRGRLKDQGWKLQVRLRTGRMSCEGAARRGAVLCCKAAKLSRSEVTTGSGATVLITLSLRRSGTSAGVDACQSQSRPRPGRRGRATRGDARSWCEVPFRRVVLRTAPCHQSFCRVAISVRVAACGGDCRRAARTPTARQLACNAAAAQGCLNRGNPRPR
eukprot:361334-Chlamydomonas_euryale.AAC.3